MHVVRHLPFPKPHLGVDTVRLVEPNTTHQGTPVDTNATSNAMTTGREQPFGMTGRENG